MSLLSCSIKNLIGDDGFTNKDNIGPFSVWDGTTIDELKISGNTYEIKKASELVWLSKQPVNTFEGKSIKLTININLNGYEFDGIANLSSQNIFKGTFDGNKKIIRNFVISKREVNYVGFIGYMGNTSTVRDLYIENATIKAEGNGFGAVGSVVGFNDGGVVHGVYSTSDIIVNATTKVRGVGGVIGYNRNGRLSLSYNAGNVKGNNLVEGVGGLVGFSESFGNAEIINSYNIGETIGHEAVGGVVGYNKDSAVSKCYNTAYVDGNLYIGGIIGYNSYNANVDNCYYNDALATRNSIGEGKGAGSRIEALNKTDFSSLESFQNYYNYTWIVMTALSGNISIRPVLIDVGRYSKIR